MSLETSLHGMGKHLEEVLEAARLDLRTEDGKPAYKAVKYGEPRVITVWPTLSIQPQTKTRQIKGTRKFDIQFTLWIILYHGLVASTLEIQDDTHERAERVETFLNSDQKWNFVDTTDSTKNKVIFGRVSFLDHPIVVAPKEELWSSSRLELIAETEEVF